MKKDKLLPILLQGSDAWNKWRAANKKEKIDLRGLDEPKLNLRECNLAGARLNKSTIYSANFTKSILKKAVLSDSKFPESYFMGCDLSDANLNNSDLRKGQFDDVICRNGLFREANLFRAKFSSADFSYSEMIKADMRRTVFEKATLHHTNFYTSNLRNANFRNADLSGASFMLSNLTGADFTGANLQGANLQGSQLIGTNFENANLGNCSVYGASVWEVNLNNCKQEDLIVTRQSKFVNHYKPEPIITVDDVRVAQFIYLMIQNPNVRAVIDTITSKVVLILGRFTSDRLDVLDGMREELRKHNYIPVLFDFENSENRDITETVSTLAHLSRFVIADLTDPKSIPHELSHIVPNLPSVPVMPIILDRQREYSMFEHFQRYPWVLDILKYSDKKSLISGLKKEIIEPSEAKFEEMKNNKK